ncbi:hypothetical protein [Prauserella flavalba]|uniref:hypothetical protein n=1 Tax=Prauserella flavalba TaxID=1477506 RepID=UPI00143D1508|nr:hypothetical protein [Prauserella flavalba]
MLNIILTWVGAVLGITVLLAMACGAFVLDFDDSRGARRGQPDIGEPTTPTT